MFNTVMVPFHYLWPGALLIKYQKRRSSCLRLESTRCKGVHCQIFDGEIPRLSLDNYYISLQYLL